MSQMYIVGRRRLQAIAGGEVYNVGSMNNNNIWNFAPIPRPGKGDRKDRESVYLQYAKTRIDI